MLWPLKVVWAESWESLLQSKDNEQYARRNKIRIFGLQPEEDCHNAYVNFFRSALHITDVGANDLEAAHSVINNQRSSATATPPRRPVVLVQFRYRDDLDKMIRARKLLKGTKYAITEDLTSVVEVFEQRFEETFQRLAEGGRTPALWYHHMVVVIKVFIRTKRLADHNGHLSCIVTKMLDIFASAGYHQYAKGAWLYCQLMKELETLPAYQDTLESFTAHGNHVVRYSSHEWYGTWCDTHSFPQ